MSKTQPPKGAVGWRKSSYSVANGACAEVAGAPGTVMVQDTVDPDGGRLQFPAAAWQEFTRRIKEA